MKPGVAHFGLFRFGLCGFSRVRFFLDLFLRAPLCATSLGERLRACPFWDWCRAVVFCGCHGGGHVKDLKSSFGLARRLPISVYIGLHWLGWVGFGSLLFCSFEPHCVQPLWMSGPGHCLFCNWCGAFVFCGSHGRVHVKDPEPSLERTRSLPMSVYFCPGCMSSVGLGGFCCACYGCQIGRLCAYHFNSS